MLTKVISGGQVGADVAALRAAHDLNIETGGYMPRGFRTRDGDRPEYADVFGVLETPSREYPPRTAMNVKSSDATLRLAHDFTTRGERLTGSLCERLGRPCYDVYWDPERGFQMGTQTVTAWLEDVETLNVAGNALPELELPAYEYLTRVFRLLRIRFE